MDQFNQSFKRLSILGNSENLDEESKTAIIKKFRETVWGTVGISFCFLAYSMYLKKTGFFTHRFSEEFHDLKIASTIMACTIFSTGVSAFILTKRFNNFIDAVYTEKVRNGTINYSDIQEYEKELQLQKKAAREERGF